MTSTNETMVMHIDPSSLVQQLQALIGLPSVTGQEDKAQEFMAGWFEEIGLEVDQWVVDVAALQRDNRFPGARCLEPRKNVVGLLRGSGGGQTLVLNGHVDVVPPGENDRWRKGPWEGVVAGGRIYGRGACDMKGSLIAMVGAVAAIKRAGIVLRGSVVVQSVIGEEDGGLGTFAALMRGHVGDAVIVGEPTRMLVAPAHSGSCSFRVRVTGKSTHACVRDEGINAFEKFLPIYAGLLHLERERAERLRHPLYAKIANPWCLNVGLVRSGTWMAIVPGELVAEGRIGVAIGEKPSSAKEELEVTIKTVAAQDPWLREHPPSVEWVGGVSESAYTSPDHPLAQILCQSIAEVTGRSAELEGMTYGSDLRLFTNGFGVPGVLFGPGDIRDAHAPDESIGVEDVLAACRVYIKAILGFCGVVG